MLQIIETKYVLGFMFSPDLSKVILIQKNKPEFQAGKLNGVGGKIESNETADQAMSREFSEEAGLVIDTWRQFGTLEGLGFNITLFFCVSNEYYSARTITAESVYMCKTNQVVTNTTDMELMGNIPWLVTMARQIALGKEHIGNFEIKEKSTWFFNSTADWGEFKNGQ